MKRELVDNQEISHPTISKKANAHNVQENNTAVFNNHETKIKK